MNTAPAFAMLVVSRPNEKSNANTTFRSHMISLAWPVSPMFAKLSGEAALGHSRR
jgi:hypothetical protein